MLKARSVVPAAFLAAALATATSACGGPGDPLQGLTGYQIAQKTVANTQAVPSVRITGTVRSSGQLVNIDLTLVRGKGCDGTLSESKVGSFRLVYDDGSSVWMKPDKKFWQTQGGKDAAVLSLLEGKYLKLKKNGKGLGPLTSFCSVRTFLSGNGGLGKKSSFGKVTTTVFRGQRAVKITEASGKGKGYAYVSDTAKPELLSISAGGSDSGTVNLTYPASPPAITTPPASEVIDGSKFGF